MNDETTATIRTYARRALPGETLPPSTAKPKRAAE